MLGYNIGLIDLCNEQILICHVHFSLWLPRVYENQLSVSARDISRELFLFDILKLNIHEVRSTEDRAFPSHGSESVIGLEGLKPKYRRNNESPCALMDAFGPVVRFVEDRCR
jgi:hypothetical protein